MKSAVSSQQRALLHIRLGMDVYSAAQDEYIGTVVGVWRSPIPDPGAERLAASQGRSGSDQNSPQNAPPVKDEEGNALALTPTQGRKISGEEIGPFPTMSIGNGGPDSQSAVYSYATGPADMQSNVTVFAVRPGRINLGIFTSSLYIPVGAVNSVSMDRVVVNVQRGRIPVEWKCRPAEAEA